MKEVDGMSKNLVALLIAGALILLSALEITYMSTKSSEITKPVTLPLDESRTKRPRQQAVVSVQGLPIQFVPGSLPARVGQAEPPMGQE